MLTKIKIVISALLGVGFASAALAGKPPTNKIGDRYPPSERSVSQSADASANAYAAVRSQIKQITAEKTLFERAMGSW